MYINAHCLRFSFPFTYIVEHPVTAQATYSRRKCLKEIRMNPLITF